jgi:drug/metabolite transporter (DMT)-like permease
MVLWAVLALLSAFFTGIKDIMAKKFFKNNVSPNQVFFEEFFLLLLICIFILFPYIEFNSIYQLWHLYLLKSISLGIATFFYFILLKKFEISLASPILNLSPLVLLILTSIFLSEVITLIQFVGIILILLSTYFLEITVFHHEREKPHLHHWKDLLKIKKISFLIYSLIVITSISFSAIFDKLILSENQINVYTNMFFTSLFIIIFLFFYFIKEKYLLKALKSIKNEPETLVISFFAIISNFLILFAIAIPSAMVSLIIPLRRTSTLFAAIIGGILFHEKHLKKKILATIGMIIGVVLILYSNPSLLSI